MYRMIRHTNQFITNHQSAAEFEAMNRVIGQGSRRHPA
jgi:hypothetical protein